MCGDESETDMKECSSSTASGCWKRLAKSRAVLNGIHHGSVQPHFWSITFNLDRILEIYIDLMLGVMSEEQSCLVNSVEPPHCCWCYHPLDASM